MKTHLLVPGRRRHSHGARCRGDGAAAENPCLSRSDFVQMTEATEIGEEWRAS
jgi:hypothetical protein